MKKLILIFIFLLIPWLLPAPGIAVCYIEKTESIKISDPMLWAFQKVESNFHVDVINWLGYAGIIQEGPEIIDEANRICKLKKIPLYFTYPESALNLFQSTQIWYIIQNHRNKTYQMKRAIKLWNSLAGKKYQNKIHTAIIEKLEQDVIIQIFNQ